MGAREQVESKYGAGGRLGRGKSTFFYIYLQLHVSKYLEEWMDSKTRAETGKEKEQRTHIKKTSFLEFWGQYVSWVFKIYMS